jgi:hypothetical protein
VPHDGRAILIVTASVLSPVLNDNATRVQSLLPFEAAGDDTITPEVVGSIICTSGGLPVSSFSVAT